MDGGPHPKRLESERFRVTPEDIGNDPANGLARALAAKLEAEAERLLRLAGPAPEGYYWDVQQERLESGLSYDVEFRVVARLKEKM